jgi:hypothetical protein
VEGSDTVFGLSTTGSIFAFHNLFAKGESPTVVTTAATTAVRHEREGAAAPDEHVVKRLKHAADP